LDLNYFEKDINNYLRGLEQVVINTAQQFGIEAERVDGLTGVWVGDQKISAIGILFNLDSYQTI
jgi:lipoyl(octanoyl) transferase